MVGHSSGEIAAAYASGALDLEAAMQVAYFRGLCVQTASLAGLMPKAGMMAVGLSEDESISYVSEIPVDCGRVVVACVNSPNSVTVSGDETAITKLQEILEARNVFNRKLRIETAYHSHHMKEVSDTYRKKIQNINPKSVSTAIFMSSVESHIVQGSGLDASYWAKNLESQVKFSQAVLGLCSRNYATNNTLPREVTTVTSSSTVDILIEIGPHAALAGPIKQILKSTKIKGNHIQYLPSLVRNEDATECVVRLAAELFNRGYPVNVNNVNMIDPTLKQHCLADLPPYSWDHTGSYWLESRFSIEYRKRASAKHYLLGFHSLDFNPLAPSWRNVIRISQLPWIRDHRIFSKIHSPIAGYITAAIQALKEHLSAAEAQGPNAKYIFRNIIIGDDLIIPDNSDGVETKFTLESTQNQESVSSWKRFQVFSCTTNREWRHHCSGYISVRYENATGFHEEGGDALLATQYHEMFQEVSSRCRTHLQPQQIYERLKMLGIEHGDAFRNIISTCTDGNDSLSVIRTPSIQTSVPVLAEQSDVIHCITLDCCLQTYFTSLMSEDQGVLKLKSIDALAISDGVLKKPGDQHHVLTSQSSTGSPYMADIIVKSIGTLSELLNPIVVASGISFYKVPTAIADAASQNIQICHRIRWELDIDHINLNRSIIFSHDKSVIQLVVDRTNSLDRISDFLVRKCLSELNESDIDRAHKHHKSLYCWMKKHTDENPRGKIPDQSRLKQEAFSYGATGQMVYHLGSKLSAVIRGEAEPLSLMKQEGMLSQLYADDEHISCYRYMCQYVDLLIHKRHDMRILEIGAGTGNATAPILRTLKAVKSGNWQYDFTDASNSALERAETEFSSWTPRIHFKKLNIELPLAEQAFDESSYDLIIAADVLHSTSNLLRSMANIRRLLKPTGKFLLLAMVKTTLYMNIIYGMLPEWWSGKVFNSNS